jgi:hypothetical protein
MEPIDRTPSAAKERAPLDRIRAARDLLAAQIEEHEAERQAAYRSGRWCGECAYQVVHEPTCCYEAEDANAHDAALIVTLAQPATARAVLAVLDAELALDDVRDLVGVDDTILALVDAILAANGGEL